LTCKTQKKYAQQRQNLQLQNRILASKQFQFVQENTGFHAISTIQTSPDKTLEAAIPMQNGSLDHQTQWHSACDLSKITSAER